MHVRDLYVLGSVTLAILAALAPPVAKAQSAKVGLATLAEQAGRTAPDAAQRQARATKAKADLQAALSKLDGFLKRSGEHVSHTWKSALAWESLERELRKPAPDEAELARISYLYYKGHAGLELPVFQTTREALRRYQLALEAVNPEFTRVREEHLHELSALLGNYETTPARDDAWTIGRKLGWLEMSGAADRGSVTEIRKRTSHPNVYLFGTSQVLNNFITRPISERSSMSETIAGAYTQAQVVTTGVLTLQTGVHAGQAAFDLRLVGQSRCDGTVSRKGPATVHSNSATGVEARVRVLLGPEGIRAEEPQAFCQTNTDIQDVEARRQMIERFARRRAGKMLPEAENAAARWAEEHIAAKMRTDAGKLVEMANRVYGDKLRNPLLRAGAFPHAHLTSDEHGMHVELLAADTFQLGAPPPPRDWKSNADVALCLHESMPENILENVLGGQEVNDEKLLYAIELFTGDVPRPLWVHARAERWSFVLSRSRPVRMGFREGGIHISLSLSELVRDDKRLPCAALISASFDVEATLDGPVLTRRGEVTIDMDRESKGGLDADGTRAFLTKKFEGVFSKQIFFDGLAPPAGGFGDRLRNLQLSDLHFENGWATLRYHLMSKTPRVTKASAGPTR